MFITNSINYYCNCPYLLWPCHESCPDAGGNHRGWHNSDGSCWFRSTV